LLVICLAGWYRQRRIARINKSFITPGGQQPYQPGYYPPQQQGQYYGSPQPGPHGQWQPAPGTQYPPNAYTGEPNSGPGNYAPPPGAPPQTQTNYTHKVGVDTMTSCVNPQQAETVATVNNGGNPVVPRWAVANLRKPPAYQLPTEILTYIIHWALPSVKITPAHAVTTSDAYMRLLYTLRQVSK
ncbi:hypothetical protein FRC01_008815, partial [Tulasnella sp. 417]